MTQAETARNVHRITKDIEEVRLKWVGSDEEPLINAVCEATTRVLIAFRDNGEEEFNPLILAILGDWILNAKMSISQLKMLGNLRS